MKTFNVTLEAIKRTIVEVQAETKEEAERSVLGDLARGELPKFDDVYDSIRINYTAEKITEEEFINNPTN